MKVRETESDTDRESESDHNDGQALKQRFYITIICQQELFMQFLD